MYDQATRRRAAAAAVWGLVLDVEGVREVRALLAAVKGERAVADGDVVRAGLLVCQATRMGEYKRHARARGKEGYRRHAQV